MTTPPPVGYARTLGLFSATMMVIGGIIGSGIFLNPSVVAARMGSRNGTLLVWVLGAVIALLGAFVFAELGRRRPLAGGGYAYLREAFGPLAGFLYGWALLLIMATGAIAAVAMTFAGYATDLFGWPVQQPMLAAGAIVLLTGHQRGGRQAGGVDPERLHACSSSLAIAVLVMAAFSAPAAGDQADGHHRQPGSTAAHGRGGAGAGALCLRRVATDQLRRRGAARSGARPPARADPRRARRGGGLPAGERGLPARARPGGIGGEQRARGGDDGGRSRASADGG